MSKQRTYRIKQIGDAFYVQYKFLCFWVYLKRYVGRLGYFKQVFNSIEKARRAVTDDIASINSKARLKERNKFIEIHKV